MNNENLDDLTPGAITVYQPKPPTAFSSIDAFQDAQRMAQALITSDLVPVAFRGRDKLGNALIALEMSQRMNVSPLVVMQNMDIIHGRPSWRSSFIIAALNSCGRFSPLRFNMSGSGDSRECYVSALSLADGATLQGPAASIKMAKDEGWYSRSGSKWKTMPELMLMYRAAAFFGRLYAPDILAGMHSDEENKDIGRQARPAPSGNGRPALLQPGQPAAAPDPEPVQDAEFVQVPQDAADQQDAPQDETQDGGYF